MFKHFLFATLCYGLLSTPALAQNYVVNIHGMVCELCSFGVAKNIRKLSFINSAEYDDGVKVDINNQLVYLAVRGDASLDREALFKAIEDGGYKPVKVWALSENGQRTEVGP